MQKDRKKKQDLQRLKTLKTRINKGKAPVSRLKLGLLFWQMALIVIQVNPLWY
jgi:hypothetical protein